MTLEERIKGQFGDMLATILNLSQQVEDLRVHRDHLLHENKELKSEVEYLGIDTAKRELLRQRSIILGESDGPEEIGTYDAHPTSAGPGE